MSKNNLASYGLLSLAVVLLMLPTVGFAQNSLSVSNSYIGATVYTDGDDTSGRFNIWNVLGDTSSQTDDHQTLVRTGRVQLMISGLSDDDEAAAPMWAEFEKGGLSGIWGDPDDGEWVVSPYLVTGQQIIRGIWRPTPSKGEIGATTASVPVMEQEVRVLHDMVRFRWTITNNDTVSHHIGLKFAADIMIDPENSGTVDQDNVVSMPGYPLIEERGFLSGSNVPTAVEFYNSQSAPTQGVRAIFEGQGATRPDVLGIDEYSAIFSSAWTYSADPASLTLKAIWDYEVFPEHQPIANNLCYGAFWKPISVAPGKSRTIIHYVVNPGSTSATNIPSVDSPRYTAALQSPKLLKYYLDPITRVEQVGPTSFRITAFLENQDTSAELRSCSFTLIPPAGIVLDASETQHTKTISVIPRDSDGSVSWLVRADGSRTGTLPCYVSVSATPMGSTVVQRDINVPAVSRQRFSSGWQQVSVPFELTDSNPATALGLGPGVLRKISRYDPSLASGYEDVVSLTPGEAYWMNLWVPATGTLTAGSYTPMQWGGSDGYEIPVRKGWNMIGNPFVYSVTMGELRFYSSSYGSLTYDEAIAKGLISRTLWCWNPSYGTWNWSTQRTALLKPWQGYWVKILSPAVQYIVITPASQIGASAGGAPPTDDNGGGEEPPPSP